MRALELFGPCVKVSGMRMCKVWPKANSCSQPSSVHMTHTTQEHSPINVFKLKICGVWLERSSMMHCFVRVVPTSTFALLKIKVHGRKRQAISSISEEHRIERYSNTGRWASKLHLEGTPKTSNTRVCLPERVMPASKTQNLDPNRGQTYGVHHHIYLPDPWSMTYERHIYTPTAYIILDYPYWISCPEL